VRRKALSPLAVAAVVPIGLAWTALLAFVDSDISQRREETALLRSADDFHSKGFLQELERYGNLSDIGASVLRREFVAILSLAIAALFAERFWRRRLVERLPTASIALGLVLLALVPSKWIWHFGVLIGVATVAIGVESNRLARRRPSPRQALVIAAAVMSVSLWASLKSNPWGPLDLSASWSRAPILFAVATIGAVAAVLVLSGKDLLRRPELVVFPAVTAALLAVTVVAFGTDAAVADGWTAPRQALSSLVPGDQSCGIADDLTIPTLRSMASLSPVGDKDEARRSGARTLLARRPSSDRWYTLPSGEIGLFLGENHSSSEDLVVTWGRLGSRTIKRLGSGVVAVPSARQATRWTFVDERAFPRRPPGADTISIDLGDDGRQPATFLTRPVSFRRETLSRLLSDSNNVPLVDPFVFEATPCASLPVLARGIAQPPNLIVEWPWGPNFANYSSPFRGVVDVYNTVSVPMDGAGEGGGFVVHWVVTDPRDALADVSPLGIGR
jgi:hypothetical protein